MMRLVLATPGSVIEIASGFPEPAIVSAARPSD
jgi:hypothetical protein